MDNKEVYLTNNFDIVRLFACLQVMLANHYISHFHLNCHYSIFSAFAGVPIFFFLAGIFIPMSFERHPQIAQFAKNRLLKILPIMWLSIFFAIALMFASGFRPDTSVAGFLKWLGIYLVYPLYTPEWLRGYGVGAINGSLWIIPAQITFYLLIPVLYLCLKIGRKPSLWIPLLFALFTAADIIVFSAFRDMGVSEDSALYRIFSSSFLKHFPMFFIGMFVYSNFEFFHKLVKNRFAIFLALHLGIFFVAQYFNPEASALASAPTLWRYPLMVSLALCALSAGYTMPDLSDKILRRNDVSYNIYVYHIPIANFVIYTMGTGWKNAIIAALATFAVAAVSYFLIEQNLMKLKKYSLRK